MLTANKLIPHGRGIAPALKKRAASVELPWDTRQKSRFEVTDSLGRRIGVFLPRGSVVRSGDLLVVDDGSLVTVTAAPEPVLVVRPCADHGSAVDLARAAYHLGNRHVAVEVQPDRLQIEPDPVLASMLKAMHFDVTDASAPFEPEGGAYAAEPQRHAHPGHDHDHDHDHGHAHAHGHDHPHDPAPDHAHAHGRHGPDAAHAEPHVHGPGCHHDGADDADWHHHAP